ncbi:IS1380 family transposase [Mycobacterium sp. NPDC003449]
MKRNAVGGLIVDHARESLVTSSGSLMMLEAIRITGLRQALSTALAPWCGRRARHDPGKALLDLAITLALGGDCLSDLAAVRAQYDLFGAVASDPTVSRLFATLSVDEHTTDRVVAALRASRASARQRAWSRARPLAGTPGTRDGGQVIVDIDATLVTAHSDKQGAQPTYKKSYGFAPMCAFVDHGQYGTGETLALDLRPGKASPFNSADHIATLSAALAQLPDGERTQVLVRADAGGASKALLHHITDAGLQYSIGFPAQGPVQAAVRTVPEHAWVAALDSDGAPREGAQVAELTRWMPTPVKPTRSPARYGPQEWPNDMRVIARRERPHPGAQLRLTDHNGWRITCFVTNTRGTGWTLPTLEVRYRQRARAEDRIRCLKDTGLRNLPFHSYQANRIWLEVVAMAADLITWTQTLAFDEHHPARKWEPKRVRFRLLAVAGRIIHTGRRRRLRLPRGWPWNHLIDTGWIRLRIA